MRLNHWFSGWSGRSVPKVRPEAAAPEEETPLHLPMQVLETRSANVWFRSDRLVMIGFKSGARINRKDVTDLYRCIKEEHGSDKMSVVMDLKSALYITRNARLHLTEEDWLGMTVALALVVNHADNRWVTELLKETAMPSQAFEQEEEATVWAKRSLRMVA